MLYEIVGKLSIAIGLIFLSLILVSLLLGVVLIKKNRFILPKLLLFMMENFHVQVEKVAKAFGLGEEIVDKVCIEVRNHLSIESFTKVQARDRILVVPQCMRHIKCPARLDSNIGIACKGCGMCIIKDIKAEVERLGYGFYVVPGGRFVERIVRAVRPKAALGVACCKDLNAAMHEISKTKCVVLGVPLIHEGCVQTKVNLIELFKRMKLGIEDSIVRADKTCTDIKPRTS